MKKIRKIRDKVILHPIMSFIILIAFVIILSGILDLFDVSVNYNKVNVKTGTIENVLVTVNSLLSLHGIKYIFSDTVSNFISFAPLSMLLILLIGFGIMDKSGFLDSFFFILTKKVPKYIVTFIFVLLCILSSITGDLSFVVFIPIGALLFKYGKRNPMVGIITAFASVGLGISMHLTISSIDSSLINTTEIAAHTISNGYSINTSCYLLIMLVAIIIGAIIITVITEKITSLRLGKYESDEEEIIEDKDALTRREKRGLLFSLFGVIIYLFIFIWNIIPGVPFGGNFLDYNQVRYIDKLFGAESFFKDGWVFIVTFLFFLAGLLYSIGAKKISNHRDMCNFLSHSLDEIGKIIVLIFFASMLVSLLKETNIGELVTALFANIINNSSISDAPLILVIFFFSLVTTYLLPNFVNRWNILSGSVVPVMMHAGFTPEFAQLLFTTGSSISYILTPFFAYFVIYISYLEKYDKDGTGMKNSISYLLPYSLSIMTMWITLLLLWYVTKLPLGINGFVIL